MDYKLIFLLIGLIASVAQSRPHMEHEAKEFIDEADEAIFELLDAINQLVTIHPKVEDIFKNIAIVGLLYQNLTDITDEAGKFKYNDYKSEEFKMALKHIHLNHHMVGNTEDFLKVTQLRISLSNLKEKPFMCKYTDKTDCTLNYHNVDAFLTSNSPSSEIIKYYWKQWRDGTKDDLMTILTSYVDIFQKTMKQKNVSAQTLYFSDYMDDNMMTEVDKVMEELKPVYQEFHTYLRYLLVQTNTDVESPTGKIYHELFENFYESLLTETAATAMNDSKTTYYKEHKYTPKKFVEESNKFFTSMGFENLPSDFWANRLEEDTNADCNMAFISTPTTYLKYCPYVTNANYFKIQDNVARLHYANQKKNLPYSFFGSYKLEHALGGATVHSLMSDEEEYMDSKYALTMMSLPVHYVHNKVWFDLFSGKIEPTKVNEHYWKLMDTYVGVVPSINRDNNNLDLPLSFFDITDNHLEKFFTKIVGYQLYESLCHTAGKYDGTKPENLHKCDFKGNTNVGTTLKEMMHLGSTKPWKQVLKVVTGNDNGMTAAPLVHYYSHFIEKSKTLNKGKKSAIQW